eukprot:g6124.t1
MSKKLNPKKFSGITLKITDEAKIFEAVAEVVSETSPTTWCVLQYAQKGVMVLVEKGTGAAANFFPLLKPDQVSFVLYQFATGEASYRVLKVAFITYVGTEVKGLVKAGVGSHRTDLQKWLTSMTALGQEIQEATIEGLTHQLGPAVNSPGGPLDEAEAAAEAAAEEEALKIMMGATTRSNTQPPDSPGKEEAGSASSSAPPSSPMPSPLGMGPVGPKAGEYKKPLPSYNGSSLKVSGEELINEAVAALASERNQVTWIWLEYPQQAVVGLRSYGTGTLEDEVVPKLKDDEVAYVFYHYSQKTAVGHVNKISFLTWIGPGVKAMIKAKVTPQRNELFRWVTRAMTFGLEVQASSIKDVLHGCSGCLAPQVLKKSFEDEMVEAGAASVEDLKSPDGTPPKKSFMAALSPSYSFTPRARTPAEQAKLLAIKPWRGTQLRIPDEFHKPIADALQDVMDEYSPLTWLTLGFCGEPRLKTLQLLNTGEGGADVFKMQLQDDQVVYVLYHYNDGQVNKLAFITWIGPDVKSLVKASVGAQRAELLNWLKSMLSLGSIYQVTKLHELLQQMGTQASSPLKQKEKAEAEQSEVTDEDQRSFIDLDGFVVPRYPGHHLKLQRQAVGQGVKDLTQKQSEVSWIILQFQSKTTLTLGKTGEGNVLDELCGAAADKEDEVPSLIGANNSTALLPDDQVLFILSAYDMKPSDGAEYLVKFAFTTWIGKQVKPIVAAAVAAQKLELLNWLGGMLAFQLELQCSTVDEFCHVAKAINQKPDWARERKKGGGQDLQLQFTDSKEMRTGWKELNKAGSEVDWIVYGYDEPGEDGAHRLKTLAMGKGGVEQWKNMLAEDKVLFALQRMMDKERPTVVKAMYVPWIGNKVPTWDKAKATGHLGYLYDFFKRYAASISGVFQPDTADELTEDALLAKVTGGGGATEREATLKTLEVVKGEGRPKDASGMSAEERQAALQKKLDALTPEQRERFLAMKAGKGSNLIGPFLPVDFQGKKEVKDALELLCNAEVDYVTLSLTGKESRTVVVEYPKLGGSKGQGTAAAELLEEELDPLSDKWKQSGALAEDRILVHVLAFPVNEKGYGAATVRKLVYLQWLGAAVKHVLKAEAQQLNPSLETFAIWACKKIDVTVSIGSHDEAAGVSGQILQKLTGSRMAGGLQIADPAASAEQSKFAELKKRASNLVIKDIEQFVKVVLGVANEEDPLSWFLYVYSPDSIDVLELKAQGEGKYPWQEYQPLLNENMSGFLLQRVMFGNPELAKISSNVTEKPYLGLVRWQGKKIEVMEKALSSHHWFSFTKKVSTLLRKKDFFLYGGYYHTEDADDLTEEKVLRHMRLLDVNEDGSVYSPIKQAAAAVEEDTSAPIVALESAPSFAVGGITLSSGGGDSASSSSASSSSSSSSASSSEAPAEQPGEEQAADEAAAPAAEMQHVKRVQPAMKRRAATQAPKFNATSPEK